VEDDYFRRGDLERLRILIRRQFDHLAIAADMKRKSEASVLFNHPLRPLYEVPVRHASAKAGGEYCYGLASLVP